VQIFYVVANTKEKSLWAERARVPREEQFVVGEAVLRTPLTGYVFGSVRFGVCMSIRSKGNGFNITHLWSLIALGDNQSVSRQLVPTGAGLSVQFKFTCHCGMASSREARGTRRIAMHSGHRP
jgi:hypothetical protein